MKRTSITQRFTKNNDTLENIYLQKANNNIKKQINMARKNLMRGKEVIKWMETKRAIVLSQ